MPVLADTHALRWWLDGSGTLSPAAREVFASKSEQIVISAVVPWELAIKTRIGKLNVGPLLQRWQEMIEAQNYTEIPIDAALAIRAGLLPLHHRDPFDRMLAAQAQATGWPIVSADPVFERYGVRRIW
jgi:PIN domain nuclease of toxin-antitoxin system